MARFSPILQNRMRLARALFLSNGSIYNALLRRLHDHFVVTTADKLANNYVIVCKSYYVQQVWADLNGPDGFYSRMQPTAADTSAVHDRITDALFDVVTHASSGVPCMYSTDSTTVRDEMSVVPYEAALVKLHNTPMALRFLACSAENGLRRPAVWLTSLFRAVHPDLQSCWSQLLDASHVPWCDDPAGLGISCS
jgi:hypothetical protein